MSEDRDVHKEWYLLERERREKINEAMKEYDEKIYHLKMKELREYCEKKGHQKGRRHDNGLGWSWYYCAYCGGRFNIKGPKDE